VPEATGPCEVRSAGTDGRRPARGVRSTISHSRLGAKPLSSELAPNAAQRSTPVAHDRPSPLCHVALLATRTARRYLTGGGSMALTPTQRKHLEARLLEERTRVVDALASYDRATRETLQQESGDLSAFPVHMADQGTATADQELEAVNAARETAELAEIDAALERLYKR